MDTFWLALYLPSLPLEVFPHAPGSLERPLAVATAEERKPRVIACNDAARQAGLRPGMPLSAALALAPDLTCRARDATAEQATLTALAGWALQFTPQVVIDAAPALRLEIGSCLRYFGGLDALRGRIEAGLDAQGYRVASGGAPTPLAALWLAHAGRRAAVRRPADLRPALDSLPLARLPLPAGLRDTLAGLGARRLRDLMALPRAGLAHRAGLGLLHLLDRAYGRIPDPQLAFVPPERFERVLDLAYPAETALALAFVGKRLSEELAGFLLGRGRAITELALQLRHRDRPATTLTLSLGRATRQADELTAVLRDKLERLALPAPVESVRLQADRLEPLASQPQDLFDDRTAQADFPLLLARLRARLGDDAVVQVASVADHRPEAAWREGVPGRAAPPLPAAPRPGWLLPVPQPLTQERGCPWPGEALDHLGPPERIESGWWDGTSIARDYHVGVGHSGRRYWLYRDRRSGDWFLHGWFG